MSDGGEPLSEEMEAKIEKELRAQHIQGFLPCEEDEEEMRLRLRAFAREILQDAEPAQKPVAYDDSVPPIWKTLAALGASITDEELARMPESQHLAHGMCACAADALLASQESERALRQKLTSLESVDKQLTDARESARSLAEVLEKAVASHKHNCLGELCAFPADLARLTLRAYREAGRGTP